jgi:hypothetical protein
MEGIGKRGVEGGVSPIWRIIIMSHSVIFEPNRTGLYDAKQTDWYTVRSLQATKLHNQQHNIYHPHDQ